MVGYSKTALWHVVVACHAMMTSFHGMALHDVTASLDGMFSWDGMLAWRGIA